jgi:hypothetical protein
MGDESAPGPRPDPPAAQDLRSGLASRRLPSRRTWILLGRTLGGFGAFLAALIAAAQFAFGDDDAGDTTTTPPTPALPAYTYAERHDDTGTISIEVPTAWGNVVDGSWAPTNIEGIEEGAVIGRKLLAAPNVDSWEEPGELETPGIFVGVSETLRGLWTPRELASTYRYDGCEFERDGPFSSGALTGWVAYSTCPGTGTRWVTLAGTRDGAPRTFVLVQAKLVADRDQEAYDRALATLELAGR